MESAIVPGIYDPTLADEDLRVDTETRVPDGASPRARRRAAGRHFVGRGGGGDARGRAGASTRGVIVTVFPDGAEKYLNEKFWTAR